MDIANAIRRAAKRKRLTVYRIAKDTGLNQSGINQFFRGDRDELRLSTAEILLDYLGFELRPKRKPKKEKHS